MKVTEGCNGKEHLGKSPFPNNDISHAPQILPVFTPESRQSPEAASVCGHIIIAMCGMAWTQAQVHRSGPQVPALTFHLTTPCRQLAA